MKKIKIICLLLFFLMVFSLVPKISEAASISSTCSNLIRNNCNQVCEQHCMSSNLGEAEKSSIQWKIHISIYESTAQCFCKCTDKSTLWYFPEFKICNMCYYTDCYIPPQDTQTPIITMHSPENNVFYNTNEVELKVSANEQVTWQYYLNSQGKKIEFEPNIIIQGKEGKNTLIVYATDNAGNTAIEEVVFYIDTIKPVINVISPENKTYDTDNILIKFTAQDENLESSWFFDGSEKIYSNEIEKDFLEGSHTLKFYATDKAGNLASETLNFYIELENDEDEEDGSNKGKCRSCERELRDYEYEEEQEPEVIYKTRGIHIEPQTINEGKEDKKIFGIPGTVIIIFLILDIILLIILAVVIFSR